MASDRLTPGLTAEITTVVDDTLVVKHMGGEGVLSTPSMIGLMERAGIQAVQAHLPEGHTTVGFEVNVKHVGGALEGAECTATARLREVIDGRKLRFDVEVKEGARTIGVGTHERRMISVTPEV